jgi:hypothetical protein
MKKILHAGIFFLFSLSCFSQNTGIGITTPRSLLHIYSGPSGNLFPFSPLVLEGSNNSYLNILTPDANESGVLFGNSTDAASGGIVYNNISTFNGLQFRANGNVTRMVVTSAGNVGIGFINPTERLQVAGNISATSFKYATPKTMYHSIPGAAFRGERSQDTTNLSIGYGSVSMFSLVPGRRLMAPVQLPQNAVMISMRAYIADNSSTENLDVTLYRKTITSTFFPDNIGTLNSAGSGGGATLYSTSIEGFGGYNEIDNLNYTYFVSIGIHGTTGLWVSNMDTLVVIIEYTLTETN